ncbi:MarR family winged helix-turn-helix transcriptional regulator [Thermoflavifilum thermophilum]|uniref:DNA-binding transcriptional regulator, MarR family n=1 Tax=Thermoflavifilum thermophilum TaxID=1393122 RepID=A0A1I7NC37_9BACT|nr:MarR family winged helix-turn-helix transcriptional regulator [Thermoflavifilum thermophilum]SFV32235.1 DNA-binding transcriptional regulator, MarR family [Thermoflavifilum thermophilum]
MPSPFDVNWQNQSVEGKIVIALERLAEAFRVLAWEVSKESGLSPIQIQILIFCLFHEQRMATVSMLAEEFHLTKATISESVRVLESRQLISKKTQKQDQRSYQIVLTAKGKKLASKVSEFANAIVQAAAHLSKPVKEHMLDGLIHMIYDLQQQGLIHPQRMCRNCRFYTTQKQQPYCALLQKILHIADLRIDCPEFQPIHS